MQKFYLKRNWEVQAPLSVCIENNLDWTHFIHCHGKSIKQYSLLFKEGRREIFLYKARVLWPLPFYKSYIVFRNYEDEPGRYRNLYLDIKSGLSSYLDARVVKNVETNTISFVSEYLYELPHYWKYFPRVFNFIFKIRMRMVADEDNRMFYKRSEFNYISDPISGPIIPNKFDFFDSNFIKNFNDCDLKFYDHYFSLINREVKEG